MADSTPAPACNALRGAGRHRATGSGPPADPLRRAAPGIHGPAHRRARRTRNQPSRLPAMAEVAQIGVVGAGFMGSGIAESAARAGVAVKLYEPQAAPLEHSRSSLEGSVARAVKRERLTADEGEALLGRIEWSTDLDALAESDLVVEAIVEDAAIKAKTFKDLDAAVRPE